MLMAISVSNRQKNWSTRSTFFEPSKKHVNPARTRPAPLQATQPRHLHSPQNLCTHAQEPSFHSTAPRGLDLDGSLQLFDHHLVMVALDSALTVSLVDRATLLDRPGETQPDAASRRVCGVLTACSPCQHEGIQLCTVTKTQRMDVGCQANDWCPQTHGILGR